MERLRIIGGRVLLRSDGEQAVDLTLESGRITGIDRDGVGTTFDARGLLVLPGIVDIHGDAFERQLQPRPGVGFPTDIALLDTEAQLLANGITTAFHGVTLSWEPGLRSLPAWRSLIDALGARSWTCDMRVHLRWEAYNLEALDTALADIAAGRVHLLAFNDHTPAILRRVDDPVTGAKYSDRAGMKLASHDDETIGIREGFRARGARICEFPMAEEVGREARANGDWVVMGCPNVVRGGSHLGWASAARMAEAGICNVLSSDYYYPAMLRAAMALGQRGVLDFTHAWNLISANPAAATGLTDRGSIAEGLKADIIIVDPAVPRVIATVVAGNIAHLTADGSARLRKGV
jgi:alpha-D-ribose 1-methylphosphonate 5-triphosphate diphosphatase